METMKANRFWKEVTDRKGLYWDLLVTKLQVQGHGFSYQWVCHLQSWLPKSCIESTHVSRLGAGACSVALRDGFSLHQRSQAVLGEADASNPLTSFDLP